MWKCVNINCDLQIKSRLNWKGQRLHNIEMNKKFIRRQHLCVKIDRNRLKIKKRSFYRFTVKFCQNSANIHEFGTQSAKILPNFFFCHWFSKSATFELFGRKICQLATLLYSRAGDQNKKRCQMLTNYTKPNLILTVILILFI